MTEIKQKQKQAIPEIVVIITMLLLFYFMFGNTIMKIFYTHKDKQIPCANNQRQIAASLMMYADDHEGILPESKTIWTNINIKSKYLKCNMAKLLSNGYLFNKKLSGINIKKVNEPETIFMTVDGISIQNDNIYYSQKDIQYRHSERVIASFADGHVEITISKTNAKLPWDLPVKIVGEKEINCNK